MTAEPTPTIQSRTLVRQGRKFDFELLSITSPAGRQLQREVVRHPGAIVVVPILDHPGTGGLAGTKSIVLIRNFRFSVNRPLLECCAGTIERPRQRDVGTGGSGGPSEGFSPGEDPAACAARELVEETGYAAQTLTPLGERGWFYTSPGMSDEQMFAYVATDLTHVGQHLEEDESIQVEVVEARRALDMVASGEIVDAKSMLAILLASRLGHLDERSGR